MSNSAQRSVRTPKKKLSEPLLATPPPSQNKRSHGLSSDSQSPTLKSSRVAGDGDLVTLQVLSTSKSIYEFQQSESLGKVDPEQVSLLLDYLVRNSEKAVNYLKAFDLDARYGPCMGISRLDRYNRAKMLNLNPPESVRQLLEQMADSPEFQENLWSKVF